jgi:hypothetical protein
MKSKNLYYTKNWLLTGSVVLSLLGMINESKAEGYGAGNGGGGLYCAGTKKTQSFDLYEGRNTYHLNIPAWDGESTRDQLIDKALEKIEAEHPKFSKQVKKYIDFFKTNKEDKQDTVLNLVEDRGYMVAEGCNYIQLVNWVDHFSDVDGNTSEGILADLNSIKKLDPLHQAALYVHEGVYRALRENVLTTRDSSLVRKYVAKVFSNREIGKPLVTYTEQHLEEGVPPNPFSSRPMSLVVTMDYRPYIEKFYIVDSISHLFVTTNDGNPSTEVHFSQWTNFELNPLTNQYQMEIPLGVPANKIDRLFGPLFFMTVERTNVLPANITFTLTDGVIVSSAIAGIQHHRGGEIQKFLGDSTRVHVSWFGPVRPKVITTHSY